MRGRPGPAVPSPRPRLPPGPPPRSRSVCNAPSQWALPRHRLPALHPHDPAPTGPPTGPGAVLENDVEFQDGDSRASDSTGPPERGPRVPARARPLPLLFPSAAHPTERRPAQCAGPPRLPPARRLQARSVPLLAPGSQRALAAEWIHGRWSKTRRGWRHGRGLKRLTRRDRRTRPRRGPVTLFPRF